MAENQSNGAAAGAQEDNKQQFAIHKIYLRDASLEAPNAPDIFRGEWKPQVNVDLGTEAKRLDDSTYECVLRVTVTAKIEDKTAYLCEVHQAGIFGVSGFDENTLEAVLASYCPTNLFPFAREAVADLVAKGGFPQMLLGPVNFEALYMQKKKQQAEQAGQQPADDAAAKPS